MKKQSFLLRSLVVALAAVSSSTVLAAGFQLNSQSATGLGRAFAGDAVIADNAAVMSRNAAAMALFERPEISVGVVAIDTAPKVKNAIYTDFGVPTNLDDINIGGVTPIPNIYYLHPINDRVTLGAGIYSHFGTSTDFGDNYPASLFFGGKTELSSFNIGLSAAYRINDQISLGAGFDVIQGSGKLERSGNITLPGVPSPLPFVALDLEASGIGFGANIGAIYELNKNNRFGLSYRYSPNVEAEIEDNAKYQNGPISGDLIINLPDLIEFSGYHAIDPKFAVHYSVQWIGWSTFDSLRVSDGTELSQYNWKNGWHFSVGGTYQLDEKITLRAGYMFDTSAQDQITSISVPDSDRHWISAGASYAWTDNSSIDFGLTYLMGRDVKVYEEQLGGLYSVDATTRANAWLYGVQYTYKF